MKIFIVILEYFDRRRVRFPKFLTPKGVPRTRDQDVGSRSESPFRITAKREIDELFGDKGISFRLFSCGQCHHKNALGDELCEKCGAQMPIINWSLAYIILLYICGMVSIVFLYLKMSNP